MKQRVITALALVVLLVVVVWQIYTPALVIVAAAFSAIAAFEIMNCAKVTNKFIKIVGVIFAFAVPFFSSATVLEPIVSADVWFKIINIFPKTMYLVILTMAFFLAMLKDYKNTKFEQVAISLIGCIFVPWSFSILAMMRDIVGYKTQVGIYLIFYALICALVTDIGAQLGGMKLGKTQMAPNISPKKTVEGAACGIILGFLANGVALTLYNKFAIIPLAQRQAAILLALSPFIQFMSMMGDLTASVLKRNFEVKDFGNIFPGHGGVMDRFDSSLFTLPLTYIVASIIF